MSFLRLFISLGTTFIVYGLYKAARHLYQEYITSPLLDLPGPKSSSFIYGSLKDIWDADNAVLHEKWVEEYGPTIKYKGLLGMNRLYTLDTKALNHVLMNSHIYEKPMGARYNLSQILGSGILVVEGDKHKQQRKIMNPAFGAAQIRELTGIFIEKSIQLRDIWAGEIAKERISARINVLSWLSKMTLDVIGLAGFNYRFDALTRDPDKNELNKAFDVAFRSATRMSIIPLLRGMFPMLRWLPAERDAEVKQASKTMSRIGSELLRNSKAALMDDDTKLEKNSMNGKDLLFLLVRANMATYLPDTQRMSDEDVLAQVPTFLVAGHETTSTATTWALFALTQNIEAQTRLREELLGMDTQNPTMDELNSLSYLDAVVRETLRLHAPAPSTIRVATKDDVLPLATPFINKRGEEQDCIRINAGQTIFIPIVSLNRAPWIWGEDSKEFKPERWQSVPETARVIPGVWGNMLTFLGGPRSCIGYRFALVEMKALLFTLVRTFEFELAVPANQIVKKTSIVQRPVIISEPGINQMPLIVRPYKSS